MITKERIELRDELIEEFKKCLILKEINGKISLARKRKFNLIINSNNENLKLTINGNNHKFPLPYQP